MHNRSNLFLRGSVLAIFGFSAQAAWAQTSPAAPSSHSSFTLWELLTAGGWVMLPLAAASLAVVSLVFYAWMTLKSDAIVTPELLVRLDAFLENEDLPALANTVAQQPEAVARVLDTALQFTDRRPDASANAVNSVAEAEASRIVARMNQRALWIMDVGVMAPMLGLLGTVVGILRSFGSLSQEGATPMRTMLLAGGVSQALVATACGLVVGIAAMGFYAYFRARVQELVSLLEGHATRLVNEIIVVHQKRRPSA